MVLIRLELATEEKDLACLIDMQARCTQSLNEQEIFQWTDSYPSPTTIRNAVQTRSQYFLMMSLDSDDKIVSSSSSSLSSISSSEEALVVGSVVLNEEQDKEWSSMPWSFHGKILVVHAFVIDPKIQGKGYGQAALASIETFALQNGYVGIRLDVFPHNPRAVRLYERNGYQYVGDVYFAGKPKGYERYACYEKKLVEQDKNADNEKVNQFGTIQ